MSKVVVHKDAARYLQRLPKQTKNRLKEILLHLESNPLENPEVKRMAGEWAGYFRIRAGKFRIIFWLDERNDTVYVDHIGPRGDVYK